MAQLKLSSESLYGYRAGLAYRNDSFTIGVWENNGGVVYVAVGDGRSSMIIEDDFRIGLRVLQVFCGAYIEQA